MAIGLLKKVYNDKGMSIKHAFEIYNKLNEQPKSITIELMLRLCLNLKCPQKALKIWKDVERIPYDDPNCGALCSLYLKCCIESKYIGINECIKTIEYIQNNAMSDKLTFHWSLIKKLLLKCNDDLDALKFIHSLIDCHFFNGVDDNLTIKHILISLYGRCSDICAAEAVFYGMNENERDIRTVNAMMAVYIGNDRNAAALKLYDQHIDAATDDSHTFAIRACDKSSNFEKGIAIHQNIKMQHRMNNLKISNALIQFYGDHKDIHNAIKIFDGSSTQIDIWSINAMMKAYIKNKMESQALALYHRNDKIARNDLSHSLALKLGNFENGMNVIQSINIESRSPFLQGAIIGFYSRNGDILGAQGVFDRIKKPNAMLVLSMMQLYAYNKMNEQALAIYDEFKQIQTAKMHLLALRICVYSNEYERGTAILQSMKVKNMRFISMLNQFICFWSHFGKIENAIQWFDEIDDRQKDAVSISKMMKVLSERGHSEKAWQLYEEHEHVPKDDQLYLMAIQTVQNMADIGKGEKIHYAIRDRLEENMILKNALIKMYGACNCIEKAQDVFRA